MTGYARKLTRAHRSFLRDLFPGEGCVLSPEELAVFSADASRERAMPWAVVRPENEEQMQEFLRWADAERMPVYPRARATGRVGNAVPVHGGVVVSTLRMNRILDISPDDFVAVAQPGVVTGDLRAACAAQDLLYPPDPASVNYSTIGGNVSTCAGGMRAVKYGVTRDWVLGLRAVLPGGKIIAPGGRSHKNVVGLDLTRLFVGSAGKLGLLSEVTLKLVPLPETTASVLAGYPDLRSALNGAGAVFRAGILPAACEFMDAGTIRAVRAVMPDVPLSPDCAAALLFMVDGTEQGVAAELERLRSVAAESGAVSLESGQGEQEEILWEARRTISPAAHHLAPNKLAEDIAVPRSRVPEAVEGCHALGDRHGLTVMCFGHLGDGNIHVNILHDATIPGQTESAHKAKEAVFRLALSLGGTISGEHGTGLTKKDFVAEQLPPEQIALMQSIKCVFDPHVIMNPGKAF